MSDESGVGYFEIGLTASVNPDGTIREEDAGAVSEIFESWLGTGNGREFLEKFHNKANLDKMSRAIGTLGGFWSVTTIDQAYADLKNANSLEPTPPTPAEAAQRKRMDREQEFEQFHAAASTAEEKELAYKSKRYDAWLKNRIADETAPEELPPDPAAAEARREQEREQQARDRKYLQVPAELREWAAAYHKMTSDAVKSKMRDPLFMEQMTAAAQVGLL